MAGFYFFVCAVFNIFASISVYTALNGDKLISEQWVGKNREESNGRLFWGTTIAYSCRNYHDCLGMRCQTETFRKRSSNASHSKLTSNYLVNVRVKVTPYKPVQAQRGGEGTPLTHSQPWRQKEVGGQHHAPVALFSGKNQYTCTRSWVVLRAGLDEQWKSRPHRDSTPVAGRCTD